MKTKLQQYKSLALISLLSFGAASLLTASAAETGGKDILHLNLTKSFTSEDVTSDATGSVWLKYHQQGRSTVQSLELNVSSLNITVPEHVLLVWDGIEVDGEGKPVLKQAAVIVPDADGRG